MVTNYPGAVTVHIEAVGRDRVVVDMLPENMTAAHNDLVAEIIKYPAGAMITIRVRGGEGCICARAAWVVGQLISKGPSRAYSMLAAMV